MPRRLIELVETHWLAASLLAIAALLILALVARGRKPLFRRYIIVGVSLFALGGLLMTGRSWDGFFGRIDFSELLVLLALGGLALLAAALIGFRRWSQRFAKTCACLLVIGLGGMLESEFGVSLAEAWRSVRGLHFVQPWWLLLLVFVPFVVLIARRSLSGLGPVRKWLAIAARSGVVAALVLALAEPRFGRPTDRVTTIFAIDRSLSVPQDVDLTLPVSEQVDRRWLRIARFVEAAVNGKGAAHRHDQAGVILFGKRPKLALPPSPAVGWRLDPLMAGPIDGQATDIAAALKLAIASFPEGYGRRIVLISDGNENIGNADELAATAKQNGVQIDSIALAPGYRNENEVLVQAVEAPRQSAEGARLPVRVLVRNASPNRLVDGLLELVRVGPDAEGIDRAEQLTIDAENPMVLDGGDGRRPPLVRLQPGLNAFRFRDRTAGEKEASYSYRAVFTPVRSANDDGSGVVMGLPGDRVANNRAGTVVVTRSKRKVLFIDGTLGDQSPHEFLIRSLLRSGIDVVLRPVDALPQAVEDLTKYLSDHDCIILADVPAESMSLERQEAIRTCVHDQGCGLVMIGGPDAFGPGGYQGTPVEAALPVDCEIKALKAAGRGGLILIMHACEMADGNRWEKEIAKLAINRLTPNDMVGVMAYGFGVGQGINWVVPFTQIGEGKNRMLAAVDSMVPGDMPDFDPFLSSAVNTLIDPQHNLAVRHIILISDGDPQYGPTGQRAIQIAAQQRVSCTTVGVATHGPAEDAKLKTIAEGTRDGRGQPGYYRSVTDPSRLPELYIKESRRISQSFIFDKPFRPALRLRGGPTEGLPDQLPDLRGFVRTTMKESPLAEMRIEGPRVFDNEFPILATWQYGLGKAAAFTSDARTNPRTQVNGWDQPWAGSEMYQKFWEQTVTWAMRAAEKGNITLTSEFRDGRVRIVVDARDDRDRPVGGLDLRGGVSLPRAPQPGEPAPTINFQRKGNGRYEAEFAAEEAGSYFVTIQGYRSGAPGQPAQLFDSARTGVTVPYSQEFADLESNTPLMRRLAEATGGKFYTDDESLLSELARSGDVFRPTPRVIRAVRPFWYWLVFAAGLLLLADVAVRRVSIEWEELSRGAEKLWTSLRTERVAAQETAAMDRLRERKRAVAEAIERERAARRFEPGTTPAAPAPAGADESLQAPPPPTAAPPPQQPKPPEATDMFSQLRKAKERADHRREKKDD